MRGRSSVTCRSTSIRNRSATGENASRIAWRGTAKPVEVELDPLEEDALDLVDVLLGVDDVAVVAGDEVGHRGHDPALVRAREQEHGSRGHGGHVAARSA